MKEWLVFDYSPVYLLPACLLGLGYAWLQYSARAPWSVRTNRILFAVRALLVALTAALLLGPAFHLTRRYFEKPVAVVAIDNSLSVALGTTGEQRSRLLNGLREMQDRLEQEGWQVRFAGLNGREVPLDSIRFDRPRSDLAGMLRAVLNRYEGGNLGAVVLVSDGIFNTGFSPGALPVFSPVLAVGVGDTVARQDLSIIEVRHNKTVYQGNRFPVEVLIRNEQMGPAATRLAVYRGAEKLAEKELQVEPENRLLTGHFELPADRSGKQRLEIRLQPLDGEATVVNNRTGFYIDVIEGRQKVLIAADVPLPDVKAWRLALESHDQFEVETAINRKVEATGYDLLILVQVPAARMPVSRLKPLLSSDIPRLVMAGPDTDLAALRATGLLDISGNASETDKVTGLMAPGFDLFHLQHNLEELLQSVPPVYVPFGEVQLPAGAKVLLNQQVGQVETANPLLYITGDEPRQAVLLGSGYWRWRLHEYARYEETVRFDELYTKLALYLASRPDKRQFRFYPQKDQYEVGEELVFTAEIYNDIFEPLDGLPVRVSIGNDSLQRAYEFVPGAGNRQFVVEDLPPGLYTYRASVTIRGRQHTVRGRLAIDNPEIEEADLTADFGVLRHLARTTGGGFYLPENLSQLTRDLLNRQVPAVIHTREQETLVLALPWALILLLALATLEWVVRKSSGGY